MNELAASLQEAPLVHGHVSRDLRHPSLVRMRCEIRHLDFATVEMDIAGWDLHPLKNAALSRRTHTPDLHGLLIKLSL